eukprot:8324811-Karenia_brevis.AAC.1
MPVWSQVFGNLGGVTGWFFTALSIQRVMLRLFAIEIFVCVDDGLWPGTTVTLPNVMTQTQWIAYVFREVVTTILE